MAAHDDSEDYSEEGFLAALLAGQRRAVEAVAASLPSLEAAAQVVSDKVGAGGRLVYVGAGSSGLIAVQDGAELPGTFGVPASGICFVIAGGVANAHQIDGAAEDDHAAGQREIEALGDMTRDVVIAVSASGSTPFTVAAAEAARRQRATIVALANRPGAPLLQVADWPMFSSTSTRKIAGS